MMNTKPDPQGQSAYSPPAPKIPHSQTNELHPFFLNSFSACVNKKRCLHQQLCFGIFARHRQTLCLVEPAQFLFPRCFVTPFFSQISHKKFVISHGRFCGLFQQPLRVLVCSVRGHVVVVFFCLGIHGTPHTRRVHPPFISARGWSPENK